MFIPWWAVALCIMFYVASLFVVLHLTWKVAEKHGIAIAKEDADIEAATERLWDALWPIRRLGIVEQLKQGKR
jgi:hypothetical protein